MDKRIVGEFRGAIDSLPTFMPHSGFLICRPESCGAYPCRTSGPCLPGTETLTAPVRSTSRPWPAPDARARRNAWPGLVDLAVTAMRTGDIDAVLELASEGRAAAAEAGLAYYVAAATALRAWAAWRSGRAEETLLLGTEALRLWDSQPVPYPFHCLALWPLTATYLNMGETEKAIGGGAADVRAPTITDARRTRGSVTGSLLRA